jgi:hypothetical protein
MSEQTAPTLRQREILQAMRQGRRLALGKSKYRVAFLDASEEVDLKTVEALVQAGWIYQFDDLDGKAVWGLTRDGLGVIAG